jgi:hypothetical protein
MPAAVTENQPVECAAPLVDEGLREAGSLRNPVARSRHLAAWALRVSRLDPERAAALLNELPDDPLSKAEALVVVAEDAVAGGYDAAPLFDAVVSLARQMPADPRLRTLNALSEVAIGLAEREPDAAAGRLHEIAAEIEGWPAGDEAEAQAQALGCALTGEALLALRDDRGRELLERAAALAEELPARDPIIGFVAGALADQEPERAVELALGIRSAEERLEARLQLLPRLTVGILPERLLEGAEADAEAIAHMRGPEALVRLGQAVMPLDPERGRKLFQRALETGESSNPQIRGLQWAGVAGAAAPFDRGWASELLAEAVTAVEAEPETIRRVTSFALMANEMAASHPEEAARLFDRAMEEAAGLEAMWECAHLLDVVLRPDRAPELDVSGIRTVIARALEWVSDEDARVPGVVGVPELARSMQQVDAAGAAAVYARWLEAARRAGDSDAMTEAALAISHWDLPASRAALEQARDLLLHRIDCTSMGEFCRRIAEQAPDLVLEVAPRIPDRRERAEALIAAAASLYPTEPDGALGLVRDLPRAADRSLALLTIVDRLLGTGGRPQPQPLLEEMP